MAYPALRPGEVHVWRAGIPQAASPADALQCLLDDDERARAARFRFDCDRNAFVFRWGTLRMLLACYIDAGASDLRFHRAPGGKPFLARPFDSCDVQFSLARSSSAAVFAIARGRNVGVDVERVRANIDVVPIARDVFSEADVACLMKLPPGRRGETFYAGWSRKEALGKADGTGLCGSLTTNDVWLSDAAGAAASGICTLRTHTGLWSLLDLELGADYRGAVAAEGRIRQIRCQNLPDVMRCR